MPASTVDPSVRFVLPQDSLYLRNMEALWAADPELAMLVEGLEGKPSYAVEPSKSGVPTLALGTSDGRRVYLHSKYQPLDEAQRLLQPIKTDQCVAFYVQGLGLAYHVELLFERASAEAVICVLEPDLLLLRTVLEIRDLSKLIESRRVLFLWKLDKVELFNRLLPQSSLMSLGFEGVTHAPSAQLHPEFHRQMQEWITEFAAYLRTQMHTLVLNGRKTCENLSRNLGWYVAASGVERLKDRHRGAPAIIVSAGPSLRKNNHLLKDAAGRAVLIAVQTTLKPLLEMGIEPHFVTSLDYHEICTRFFEKLPPTLRTELVAEPKATNLIFGMHPGPLSLLGNDFADGLLREMRLGKGRLQAGATVAHLAYYLAEHLGCDPIIFVGQDLGFSDGLCYMPGTSYDDVWRPELSRFCTVEMKQWEQIARDRHMLRRVCDYQGRPTYTEERLFSYLQQFERDFAKTTRRIIDATEGGVRKQGATPMRLAEALEQYCKSPLTQVAEDYPGLRWDRIDECTASVRRRRDEAQEIEQISRDTLPLLEQVRDSLHDQSQVNRLIGRIDGLRARMATLSHCYELIMQLTQTTELMRFQHDRRIAAAKVDGVEKQRRQVTRDIENVRAVIDAAKQFQRLMDEVIESLPELARRAGSKEVVA